ncbi:MAG: M17 family peptidase N-terminal domain-containing protein, partial [Cyanobium sp.]
MEFRCIAQGLADALDAWDGDTLAVGLFATDPEGATHPLRQELSRRFGEVLAEQLDQRGFKGKPSDCVSFARLEGSPANLIVVGLGEPAGFNHTALRAAAAVAAGAAAKLRCQHLGLALPCEGLDGAEAAAAMAEAVRLSLYRDQRFRSEPDDQPSPECLSLLALPPGAEAGLAGVSARCAGVELARQLVAAPPNVATPAHLADTAAAIARDFAIELKVLERSDCEALGMGAYLGVAQGSDLPPKFIHLTYRPDGAVQRRVALVGKGLTFDSGGYNLKTAGSQIEMMK